MKVSIANSLWHTAGFASGLTVAALCIMFTDHLDVDARRFIFATLATVAVTLLGFVLAALSILSALTDRGLVDKLIKAGHWAQIMGHFKVTTRLLLILLVTAILFLLATEAHQQIALAVSGFISAFSFVAVARAGRYLFLILEYRSG